MDDDFDLREPHVFDRPLRSCPACGATELLPVAEGGELHFLCQECARCWFVEFGAASRVDPSTCSECEHYGRCAAVFAADHPPAR